MTLIISLMLLFGLYPDLGMYTKVVLAALLFVFWCLRMEFYDFTVGKVIQNINGNGI